MQCRSLKRGGCGVSVYSLSRGPTVNASGQLERADWEGGHGHHGDWVQDGLAHQLRVMGNHLSTHGRLLANHGGLCGRCRSAVHLAVRERVRDVAHDCWLCDRNGLRVDCRKVGDSDMANGLRARSQLHRARGGRGDVGHVLGAWLDDVVDGLDDRGVRSRSRVSNDGRLQAGRGHYMGLGRR